MREPRGVNGQQVPPARGGGGPGRVPRRPVALDFPAGAAWEVPGSALRVQPPRSRAPQPGGS